MNNTLEVKKLKFLTVENDQRSRQTTRLNCAG